MDRKAIEDLFSPFGQVVVKRMFGGHGVYADGLMFALEAFGEIYLKPDEESRPVFEAQGLRPFIYESLRGTMVMSYRLMPEAAHEDVDVLREWCDRARQAALRVSAGKTKGGGKRIKRASPDNRSKKKRI